MRKRAALALATAWLFLGCPSRPAVLVYDLAARASVAELSSPREVLRFGTPAAEPHLADGFFHETATGEEIAFVWSRIDCELSFTWPDVVARAAVVDLAPYKAVPSQKADVTLNGTKIASLTLDTRRRHRIELPATAQRVGENRIKFFFRASASPAEQDRTSGDVRQLSAAFYAMVVGRAEDPALLDLLGRDAPEPLAAVREGGVPQLLQMGTSTVRFALQLPVHAELRFTPDLHRLARAAGTAATFRVTSQDASSGERELWSKTITASNRTPEEVALRLTGGQPALVRLALHVSGIGRTDRFSWGIWGAPRVMARHPFDPLAPAAVTDDERRRGDAIREGLGKPNVVLVILDAGRAAQFGVYGYSRPTTPAIDALARDGVVFENAFTPAVYTLGAMSSVWTSQYPDRHHSAVSFASKLPKDRLTLAELLSAQGVTTAGFVANAIAGAFSGFDRGFGEFHEVYREAGSSSASSFRKVLPAWFERQKDRPFFAYVHFREPHFPYDPEPPFDTKFGPDGPIPKQVRRDSKFLDAFNRGQRAPTPEEIAHLARLYDGNLATADHEVGEIERMLRQSGLWERTVVIVAADHGEQLFEHGWIGHNVQLYEQSVHVPLIIRFPSGQGPSGWRVRGLVDLLDIAPTIADLMGVLGKGGSATRFEGRSLLPVIAGAPGKPAVLARTIWDRPRYALRTEREKFIYDSRSGEESLYDLVADPKEEHDRHKEEPLKAAFYRETLHTTVARLARRGPSEGAAAGPSCEECENLKALGYIDSAVKCSCD